MLICSDRERSLNQVFAGDLTAVVGAVYQCHSQALTASRAEGNLLQNDSNHVTFPKITATRYRSTVKLKARYLQSETCKCPESFELNCAEQLTGQRVI
jgi:hypothetical protein